MMIQFEEVTKRYPGSFEALNQVNFSLDRGEMVFLTGQSGAGKSTFLKLVALMETPSSGAITVNGRQLHRIKNRNEIATHRSEIGFIFQSPHLLNDRTVCENVALPLLIQGESLATVTKRVSAALDLVGLLNKENCFPMHLSCGEQQRVGIARAVVHKPALLLADEPTGNLDPTLSLEIMKLFEQFNQVGVSVLVVTHDLAMIARMRHRVEVLRGGKLC
jgi:cell division transport system ATP-binding protein